MTRLLALLAASVVLSLLPAIANAHGAIVFPPSRNAIDGELDPWAKGVPYPVIFNSTSPVCHGGDDRGRGANCTLAHATYDAPQWCPMADSVKDDRTVPYDDQGLSGSNGQACYWFSNGCSIGCEQCDGVTRGPMPGFSMAECWYPYPNHTERAEPPRNAAGAILTGLCRSARVGGDCDVDAAGSIATTGWKNQTLAACVSKAHSCKNANYVSFSAENADCSWYKACDVDHLQFAPRGYQTEVIRPQPLPSGPPPAPPGPRTHACGTGMCAGMAVEAPDECLGSCRRKMNQCNSTAFADKPAICDPALRTYNTNATCGGPHDWYQFAPWRAPGHAPVLDSCGMAGGAPHRGGFGAQYFNTTNAGQGMKGSEVLKPRPTGVRWQAGATVEVSWAIEANRTLPSVSSVRPT